MFKYVTTTIINTNKDFTTGKPLWSALNENPDDGTVGSFNVKRHLKFLKPNVFAIYKAEAYDPTFAKATIDLSTITQPSGIFRIAMYIRLSGSQNSYYSNDFVFKGKPLYIEFEKKEGEAAAELAKRVAAIANKYITMVYEFGIVKVSAEDTKIVIDAVDEYQLFTKCNLEWYNPDGGFQFCCNTEGAYEVIAKALPADDPEYDGANTIVQGKQGFGTYNWLLHNFRLPTAANTRWTRIIADETPVLGAKYNEYIIEYCVNRGILGSDAVGDLVKSKTQHVFYVNQTVAADFEAGLAAIGGITNGPTGNDSISSATEAANNAITRVSALEKQVEDLKTQLADKADTTALEAKQDTLTSGDGIDIADNKVSVKLNGDTLTADASGLKVTDGKFASA